MRTLHPRALTFARATHTTRACRLSRRRSALVVVPYNLQQSWPAGCAPYPLRLAAIEALNALAGAPADSGLLSAAAHAGYYNTTARPTSAAGALAAALARHRVVVAGGVFALHRVAPVYSLALPTFDGCSERSPGHATALVFEAMAAGAAAVVEDALVPHMASLGLTPGTHFIAAEASPAGLLGVLRAWLRPPAGAAAAVDARLRGIAAAGRAAVLRRFTTTRVHRQVRAAAAAATQLADQRLAAVVADQRHVRSAPPEAQGGASDGAGTLAAAAAADDAAPTAAPVVGVTDAGAAAAPSAVAYAAPFAPEAFRGPDAALPAAGEGAAANLAGTASADTAADTAADAATGASTVLAASAVPSAPEEVDGVAALRAAAHVLVHPGDAQVLEPLFALVEHWVRTFSGGRARTVVLNFVTDENRQVGGGGGLAPARVTCCVCVGARWGNACLCVWGGLPPLRPLATRV
jgi:hypothetical protein